MSFKIEQGLFSPDFIDYHAVLGVPVNTDPKDIRKQYLKIVRRLHPDSFDQVNQGDRQRAEEFLSKLVNPAYKKFSQEKEYQEHCVILKLKGQQAQRQQETVLLTGEAARQLAGAGDVEAAYKAALRELAEKQYEHLGQTLEITGQISELNLIYLMRTANRADGDRQRLSQSPGGTAGVSFSRPSPFAPPPKPTPPTTAQLVEACLRRAYEFEAKQNYPKAMLELREAIQISPRSSTAHSRLGMIYLKNKQLTMARIHFDKALEIDPKDMIALEGRKRVTPGGAQAQTEAKGKKPNKPSVKGDNSKGSGGGLFGLFGGKKK